MILLLGRAGMTAAGGGGGAVQAQAEVHAQVQAPMGWLDRADWYFCVVRAWKLL